MATSVDSPHRRAFLSFLAASPLLASAGLTPRWFEELLSAPVAAQDDVLIKSVREALNVMDFRTAAKAKLSVAHFTFFDEGVFNEETLRANREAFTKYQIRMRRLLGIGKIDQSIQLFGVTWDSPLYLCPVGRLKGIHPEGNLAVARAARSKRTLEVMSGVDDFEQVNALRGQPVWISGSTSPEALKQLEAAGTPAIMWTIDGVGGGNQIGARSLQRAGVANLERKNDPRCVSRCSSRKRRLRDFRGHSTP